jgi:hypothetical protein
MKRRWAVLGAMVWAASAGAAGAELVSYGFSGNLSQVRRSDEGTSYSGASAGTRFFGVFSFDTSVPLEPFPSEMSAASVYSNAFRVRMKIGDNRFISTTCSPFTMFSAGGVSVQDQCGAFNDDIYGSFAMGLNGDLPGGTIDDARLLGEVPFSSRSVFLNVIDGDGDAALSADMEGEISRLHKIRASVARAWENGWDGRDDVDFPASPTPEPSTLILFGTGLAALAGWRRRRGPDA